MIEGVLFDVSWLYSQSSPNLHLPNLAKNLQISFFSVANLQISFFSVATSFSFSLSFSLSFSFFSATLVDVDGVGDKAPVAVAESGFSFFAAGCNFPVSSLSSAPFLASIVDLLSSDFFSFSFSFSAAAFAAFLALIFSRRLALEVSTVVGVLTTGTMEAVAALAGVGTVVKDALSSASAPASAVAAAAAVAALVASAAAVTVASFFAAALAPGVCLACW